jgi:mono/diheme cytochrome c family protein
MGRLGAYGSALIATQLVLTASPLAKETKKERAAAPSKAQAAAIERGEYIVESSGCQHCHTPWIFDKELGVPRPDRTRMLSGHPAGAPDPMSKYTAPDMAVIGPTFTSFAMPFGIVYSPNLTPDKDTGLGTWTEGMFIKTMRTGRHMGGEKTARPILPPMPWDQLNALTDDDLKAVFAYLRSIPPIKNVVQDPKVPPQALQQIGVALDKTLEQMKAKPRSGHR